MSGQASREVPRGESVQFKEALPVIGSVEANAIVNAALNRWTAPDLKSAIAWKSALDQRFPDQASAADFWHQAASESFRDFFVWGHDHDFGFGVTRAGAMGQRHIEIASEYLSLGMLPSDLNGQQVLDIGCWSGGDALVLEGLGAKVEAIEEHAKSASSARALFETCGSSVVVSEASLYVDDQSKASSYDLIYCSGVIYHVTDPLLFLRICFAYLKPGGSLLLETKASSSSESICGYSGTLVKGWNWYAPSKIALGRWLVDAGFLPGEVELFVRSNGRLLAKATKGDFRVLPESAGFSRPGSWLQQVV